ncbi:MAG: hypothetical protein JXA21_03320 [Anaerolineae bacterium]|nr:hypothetical protein [Anaerolineae bacterium]
MTHKKAIGIVGILLILLMGLSACIVYNPGTPEAAPTSTTTPKPPATTEEGSASAATTAATTPEKADDKFPEILVLHPDATDIEISVESHTYIYVVPMMIADAIAYLEPAFKEMGWIELGKPTVMGHLATLNLQNDDYRLNISMQDNELSKSTRIQMRLTEQ